MLNFDEEVKKLQSSLEFEDVENAVYQEDMSETSGMTGEYEE